VTSPVGARAAAPPRRLLRSAAAAAAAGACTAALGFLLREALLSDGMEELLNLLGAAHKVVAPELVRRVFDELDEGDEKAPRVRLVRDQTLD
jgi:hypothetical protein